MSDTSVQDEAPVEVTVELFEPTTGPGKYDAHVRKLIEADATRSPELVEAGKHYSTVVRFPKEETLQNGKRKPAVAKYKRFFQDSAKALEMTAREIGSVDVDEDHVDIRFIVVPAIKRPRKNTPTEPDAKDSTADIDSKGKSKGKSADTPDTVAA